MTELNFTDQNFNEEVLNSKEAVLVDFWAPWCGPCKRQGPIIDELAQEFEEKLVKIGKLNVEENTTTAQKYNIMSIPTIIIFKDGRVKEAMTGLQSKETLEGKLNKLLT